MAKKERYFLDAILSGGEAAADSFTDNEAIKAVPVIGTAIKFLKGIDDLRDRALAAKLEAFVRSPQIQSPDVAEKLKKKLAEDPAESQRMGETLFLVLEKITDLDKPAVLAAVFAAYLDSKVSAMALRRLAHAIDIAFTDDLVALSMWDSNFHVAYGSDWKRNLVPAGLAAPVPSDSRHGGSEIYYQITELGRTLHEILFDAGYHRSRDEDTAS